MKRKYVGIAIIILLAGIMTLIFMYAPKAYDWTITFSPEDDQPFGCSVFDDVMKNSLPKGYEVKEDYTQDISPQTAAIIYAKNKIEGYYSDTLTMKAEVARAEKLNNFVKRGGVLILATAEIDNYGSDDIYQIYGLDDEDIMVSSPNNDYELERLIERCHKYKQYRLKANWLEDDSTFLVQPFMIYYHKMADYFRPDKYKPLLNYYNNSIDTTFTIAYSKKMGKGLIEYVSVPLFFTNYGVMDKNASKITDRLLQPVAGRHVVRIIGKNVEVLPEFSGKNTSEFSYLLSRPALRWALYLSVIVIAIFCLFTARRRMRAIPLPKETTNSTFEFAKYMGTFYFARHQHREPVLAKYKSLMQELNDYYGWDADKMSNQDLADSIASKTGESSEKIIQLIRTVNSLKHDHLIDQKSMMKLIDYITLLRSKL